MNVYLQYTNKDGHTRRSNLGLLGAEVYGRVGDPLKLEPGEAPPPQRCRISRATQSPAAAPGRGVWIAEPLEGAVDVRLDGKPLVSPREVRDGAELELGKVLVIVRIVPTTRGIELDLPPPRPTPEPPLPEPTPAPVALMTPDPSESAESLRKLEWDLARAYEELETLRRLLRREQDEHLRTKHDRQQAKDESRGHAAVAQELREELGKVTAKQKKVADELDEAKRRIDELRVVADAARGEQRADQKALRDEKERQKKILAELDAVRADVRLQQSANEQLHRINEERAKRSEELLGVLAALKEHQAPMERELRAARDENDKLSKEILSLRAEVDGLRPQAHEAADLRRRLDDLRHRQEQAPAPRPPSPGQAAPGAGDLESRAADGIAAALLDAQVQIAQAVGTLETLPASGGHWVITERALAVLSIALERARFASSSVDSLRKLLRPRG